MHKYKPSTSFQTIYKMSQIFLWIRHHSWAPHKFGWTSEWYSKPSVIQINNSKSHMKFSYGQSSIRTFYKEMYALAHSLRHSTHPFFSSSSKYGSTQTELAVLDYSIYMQKLLTHSCDWMCWTLTDRVKSGRIKAIFGNFMFMFIFKGMNVNHLAARHRRLSFLRLSHFKIRIHAEVVYYEFPIVEENWITHKLFYR